MKIVPKSLLSALLSFGLLPVPIWAQNVPGSAAKTYYHTNTIEAGGYLYERFNADMSVAFPSYTRSNASSTTTSATKIGEVKLLTSSVRIDNGYANSVTEGGFQDRFTVTNAEHAGQAGTLTGSLRVHLEHNAAYTLKDYGYYNEFGVAISSDMANAAYWIHGGGGAYAAFYENYLYATPKDLSFDLPFTIPFVYGVPFDVGVWVFSLAKTGYGNGQPVSIFHNATVNWNGSLKVKDAAGVTLPASSYTVRGQTSVNYEKAIGYPSPFVSVSTSVASLSEPLTENASVFFTLNKPAKEDLTVYYELSGTAERLTDYGLSAIEKIVIKKGAQGAVLTISALDDTIKESRETILVNIKTGLGYRVSGINRCRIEIPANDR